MAIIQEKSQRDAKTRGDIKPLSETLRLEEYFVNDSENKKYIMQQLHPLNYTFS